MGYDLSILMPAIRSEKWLGVYESVEKAFSGTWELIVISSKPLPPELDEKENVNYVYSDRSPAQKQQQGLCEAEGDWVTSMSDDSIWLPGTIDKAFEVVRDLPYRHFAVLKYLEGQYTEYPPYHQARWGWKTNYEFMRDDKYYLCHTHDSSSFPGIPENTPVISVAFISRKILVKIGGWDCKFQTLAMANVDLAVRLMKAKCKYTIVDLVVQVCGWMPGKDGDHKPVHDAQTLDDEPLIEQMYSTNDFEDRVEIDLANWKETEPVWKRLSGSC